MAATLADDIFKSNFVNEIVLISITISLKFVLKGPNGNKSSLVQVMAWRRIGDQPLYEPMMTQINDAYMRHPASHIFLKVTSLAMGQSCDCSSASLTIGCNQTAMKGSKVINSADRVDTWILIINSPLDTWRNNNVVITSKLRQNDVFLT